MDEAIAFVKEKSIYENDVTIVFILSYIKPCIRLSLH